jgi:hypothetical protein
MKVLDRLFARRHANLSSALALRVGEVPFELGAAGEADCRHVAIVQIEPGDYEAGFRCYVCGEVFSEEAALALRRRNRPNDDPGGETAGDRAPRPRPRGGLPMLTAAKPMPPDDGGLPPRLEGHIRAFPADWGGQRSS